VTLDGLNALPREAAAAALERCCGARRWVDVMCEARPFADVPGLRAAALRADAALEPDDWREAFTHHPRIGDLSALREKFAGTAAWARGEQAGAAGADEATLAALAEGNREYEARFGYIFIVCATGLTAREMLDRLRARMPNAPDQELAIAAGEQRRITALRLAKLIEEGA